MVTARLECFLEGRSELSIKIRVDQRVERRVEVADPEADGYHHWRTVTHLAAAEGRDDVPATQTHTVASLRLWTAYRSVDMLTVARSG